MPTRTCVSCRTKGTPSELLRIAASPDGALCAGRQQTGRGAWVCSVACFIAAAEKGKLGRALRTSVDKTSAAGVAEQVQRHFEVS